MNGKKVKRIIVATALIAVLAISGISAYFTDGDNATNTFTVGSVQIDLQEPNWNPDDAEHKMLNITPEQEFDKNPQVKNIGVNDAYVFLEVLVPRANVVVAEENGTKAPAPADTQLFTYTTKSGWTPVVQKEATTVDGKNVYKYVYAYGSSTAMTALLPNSTTTTPLFDKIKFANIVEDQAQTAKGGTALEKQDLSVKVNAYAIQTNNINDADGTAKTAPTDVWAVLSTQAPTTDMPDGVTEDPRTDAITPTT